MVLRIDGVEAKRSEQFHRCAARHPRDGLGAFGKAREIVMPGNYLFQTPGGFERWTKMGVWLLAVPLLTCLGKAHEGGCPQILHELVS